MIVLVETDGERIAIDVNLIISVAEREYGCLVMYRVSDRAVHTVDGVFEVEVKSPFDEVLDLIRTCRQEYVI